MLKRLALVNLIFVMLGFLVACQEEAPTQTKEVAKPVKTLKMGKSASLKYRSFPGKVEAGQYVELSFQVKGKLIQFPVKKGQAIEQGALIAQIEDTDYKIKVREAKANVEEQEATHHRLVELLEKKFVSQAEYDKQKAQYEIAIANLNLAEQNLAYTTLSAPFTGRIADTFVDNFQFVNPKEPIVLLQNIENIDIVIDVPENLIIKINQTEIADQYATFEAAPNQSYPVTYKKHELNADNATQTYRVHMTLPAPKEITVLPGMTATVHFAFKQQGDSFLLIPSSAVFADPENKKFVWIIDPKSSRTQAVEVEVGALEDNQIKILSGLKLGDEVIVAGVHSLRADQLVQPIAK